jgi:hypothetical protein
MKLTPYHPLVPDLTIHGAIPPLPHIYSWYIIEMYVFYILSSMR